MSAQQGDASKETPAHGLMWKHSDLPSVFPLQVKTRPGRNYYLRLEDVETRKDVLAAFIEGGRFFRVLVPPGTFRVRIAHGFRWQDEDTLFGPKTGRTELPDPLTFRVTGLRTKAGHIIDLTRDDAGLLAGLRVDDLAICQTLASLPTANPASVRAAEASMGVRWWEDEEIAPGQAEAAQVLRRAYLRQRLYRYEVRGRQC